MALAHTIGDNTAAYRRGDWFEKRHALTQHWAHYCTPLKTGAVDQEKGMSQGNKKRALKKALFSSGSKKFKKIGRLPPEEQAEAHKTLMRDVAGDLGITDEKSLQQLEDHAIKEFRRKMN